MSVPEFIALVDEGHEIEFIYEGRKYSVTYGEINEKEVISIRSGQQSAQRSLTSQTEIRPSTVYMSTFMLAEPTAQEQARTSEPSEEQAQGKYTGRKPIPTDWTRFGQLYGEWRAKNITGRDFMRRMDMSANTFYRRVREYEIRHGITEQTSA